MVFIDLQPGLRLALRHWWHIVWTGFVGLLIGVIPGAGASIAAFALQHRGKVHYDEGDYEEGEWVENPDTGAMEWHAADGTVLTQAEWNQQAEAASAAAAEAGRP